VCSPHLGASSVAAPPGQPAPTAPYEAEVQALSADVDLLAQLNQLQLTAKQVDALLSLATQRQSIAQGLAPKREQVCNALASVLRQKRQLLLGDQPVPEELEDKIAKLNTELAALTYAEVEQSKRLVDELRKVLTAAQLSALTGEYQARASAADLLDWIRGLGEDEYDEEADATAEELALPEQGFTAEQVRKILDEARGMDQGTFERNQPALIDKLLPAYVLSEAAQTQMLMDLLANPRLIPLLEDKKAAQSG